MSKISIIVPVYNTEKYLDRCIQSILAQTYTDFELLLVDDGSTDSSGAICDKYAAEDSRVRVFHKENGGASAARNLGLDNAQGEWVTFCDSDDWLDSDLYEKMCKSAENEQSEMVVSGVKIDEKGKSIWTLQCPRDYVNKESMANLRMIEGPIFSSIWNKLIKREFLDRHNIRFDARLQMWDDLWLVLRLRFFAPKISIVGDSFYYYRMTESPSITKSSISKKVSSQLLCASLLKNFFIENNAKEQYSVLINWLGFHAVENLFDEGMYSDWKSLLPQKTVGLWKFKSYYGTLRIIQYSLVLFGGKLGEMLLWIYKNIKGRLVK